MSDQNANSSESTSERIFLRSLEQFKEFLDITPLEIELAEGLNPRIHSQTVTALEAIGKFLQVDQSYICYKEPGKKSLQVVQWSRFPKPPNVLANPKYQTEYRLFSTNQPTELILVKDDSEISKESTEGFSEVGISSTLHIPMFHESKIQGWLGFSGFQQEIDISKGLILLVWMFGLILVGGLENPNPSEEDIHDSSPFWTYLHRFDFSTFANGHSDQLINITRQIAENLGFTEETLNVILQGAFLHDVGKFTIPDEILEKKQLLTTEEVKVIKYHPSTAFKLLSQIPVLKNAVEIPYCHHEYWDGTGYPQGLKGEEIPLTARIFAVADVFDALCSDRPYRKAWNKIDAINYIKDNSGTQFDPAVVPEFLKVVQAD
jgi:HD-GYP domain-containing protein (c-di-GMP phosphodiesterase class II)